MSNDVSNKFIYLDTINAIDPNPTDGIYEWDVPTFLQQLSEENYPYIKPLKITFTNTFYQIDGKEFIWYEHDGVSETELTVTLTGNYDSIIDFFRDLLKYMNKESYENGNGYIYDYRYDKNKNTATISLNNTNTWRPKHNTDIGSLNYNIGYRNTGAYSLNNSHTTDTNPILDTDIVVKVSSNIIYTNTYDSQFEGVTNTFLQIPVSPFESNFTYNFSDDMLFALNRNVVTIQLSLLKNDLTEGINMRNGRFAITMAIPYVELDEENEINISSGGTTTTTNTSVTIARNRGCVDKSNPDFRP
mgnify:CR=1 FL=1